MATRPVPIALIAMLAFGCEKPTHENIENWAGTKKGPAKLRSAFLDEGLDPDLSAHAAAVMIRNGRDGEVRAELDRMKEARRATVVAKLAPRMWETARIEGEMLRPAPHQTVAKDALVMLRKHADPAARTLIDGYLIDWYAVPSYEGRANAGAHLGASVMRMIGPPAAKKMMGVLTALLASPGQTRKRIGLELLLAVAVTADPETVKYLIEVARMDRGDPELPTRAMRALYMAYVDPERLFDVIDPATAAASLGPHLDALVKVANDDRMPPAAADAAVALIRSVGMPRCLPPLLAMIPHPHANPVFRYMGPDHALKCGGVQAIKDVVRAMPKQPYDQRRLAGSVVVAIAGMEPRDQVLAALRDLLGDKSLVARWVAVETLAAMKSVEDARKIASVKGGGDRLDGYWGGSAGKPEPTLGQRAKELSDLLAKPAK
jgi:hypothetical protein